MKFSYTILISCKKLGKATCQQCDKVCSSEGNLKKYISEIHDKSTRVGCLLCDNMFSNKCNLKQHVL